MRTQNNELKKDNNEIEEGSSQETSRYNRWIMFKREDNRVLAIDKMILNFDGKKDDTQGSNLRSTICVKVKSEKKII